MPYNLLLIGCGNMGGALIKGWCDSSLLSTAYVIEPNTLAYKNNAIIQLAAIENLPPAFQPDMIVLAVKPQIMSDILPLYRRFSGVAPFLSIAAGKTLHYFETELGQDTAIIRTMPNLAATVGRGVTACAANNHVSETQRDIATRLMEAVGTVHWIDEAQMDAITALSGSGPAYIFYLEELLCDAGESLGLEKDFAAALARQTIIGSAELLRQSPEPAADLRTQVTSKGGTTEAALAILMQDGKLSSIFRTALAAAATRARQLAN